MASLLLYPSIITLMHRPRLHIDNLISLEFQSFNISVGLHRYGDVDWIVDVGVVAVHLVFVLFHVMLLIS